MSRLLPLILLVFLPALAPGQSPEEEPERLVGDWLRAQERAGMRLVRLAFIEHAEHEVDSPRGVRRTRTEVRFVTDVGSDRTTQEVLRAVVDGKPVPPEEIEKWEQRRAYMLKPYLQAADWLLAPPQKLFRHVRPVSGLLPEMLDGQRALRLDLAAPEQESPLERLTAWFSADRSRLLRTRLLYRPKPDAPPMQVITDYARREGMDLPTRRLTEGTMQYKRRTRTYTVLVNVNARYEGYRLDWR